MGQLDTLFAPERVAVVGATESDGAVGRAIMENLLDGYEGDVVPVNPSSEEVFGLDCYDDLTQIDGVELAIVVVPPGIVNDVLRQAGEAGIRDAAVITAGFGESGSEGVEREHEMKEIAEEYDINLVGPNCLGVISTSVGMNATFTEKSAIPGNISFMSQSGAFISAVLDWAGDHNVGFNDIVSLGNKAVLDEGSFIDYWGDDPDTDVILGYLEDIENGREFIDTAREVTKDTPIVAVKSGRTEAGASAAASHTGAIAGSERAYEAGLEQAGVIRANSVQELFDYATILGDQPMPESNDIAIVTNAGGPGVMATDAIGDSGLEMASFTDESLEQLEEAMPSEANIFNPVDVLGDASAETYEQALDIVLDDPNVGSVIVVSSPQSIDFENLAEVMIEKHEEYGVPMAASLMGGETAEVPAEMLGEAGIPSYFDPARGVNSLDALREYAEIQQHEYAEPKAFDVDRERAREILERTKERDTNKLGVEAMELLEAYGIPTPDGAIVSDKNAAVEAAKEIDGDVVMKIVSPDILHKSDIGGVEVAVPDDEVASTYDDLIARARNYQPDATILGVQVQEMADLDAGTETIVGINRDPQFGPLVMFGLGGIFVEVLEDATFRVAPVSEPEAEEMIDEIDSAPLLRGARGREPVDEAGVVETIQRISKLVTDFPAILELDINPLVATPDGVVAVDIRATVDQEAL
ncbi:MULTISPECIES: acetate--CoA ligase family protein [unclassified Halorhabdus]|uniref:acetate--CoA ligase family protein n=1 Tax=unclassified Halorhabdus TaxID=2621901 RepID=UPI0023DBC434|nr:MULTISPECIES: acetate--CoA ligase family protein [unclassified Halorhabdus]WEL18450.1 Acyl-CoA synthetase (NDP forming) [Halorhabdus sp. SVX81]WEL22334.1 Acyl-CoA synthetase (NDP forming) [Halorhabdus sp. BNX81]